MRRQMANAIPASPLGETSHDSVPCESAAATALSAILAGTGLLGVAIADAALLSRPPKELDRKRSKLATGGGSHFPNPEP